MSIVLIKALQLILCLSLLVVLHEGGHFMFAKLFGVKVEKFYLFFNPKFHLFSTRDKWFTRLFPRFKDNETEYGIGWIPLGGYVKIAGMVDESMDTEQLKQPAQPNEFRVQKVWKRFFIMFGGVLMNFLTAWALYSAILLFWGKEYIPIDNVKDGFEYNDYAKNAGFQDGDVPIVIDGDSITSIESTRSLIRPLAEASTVTVRRGGAEKQIAMPQDESVITLMNMNPPLVSGIRMKAEIDSVLTDMPAYQVGIQKGSIIRKVNDIPVDWIADYYARIVAHRDSVLSAPNCTHADSLMLRTMTLVCERPNPAELDTFTVNLTEKYELGIIFKGITTEHRSYSVLSCIPAGLSLGWKTLTDYVSDLRYVATKEGANSVGSFVTIGSIFPSAWDWQAFWMMTAFISIILAVMNLLPIPGLDGGHIAILMYEAITGHEPSEKFMIWAERIGIGILVLLMLLAMKNDIVNFIL